jgi:hypothetical protein
VDYRGISINPGANAELVIDGLPPLDPPHWSRYITLAEAQALLPGSGATPPVRNGIMETVIDRLWDGPVVNAGSLDAEPLVSIETTLKQLCRWIGG